jgi:hypothetical protein
LETAVKKVGVKESIEHLTEKYPEYFAIKYQDVIVFQTDTVFVQPKDGTIVSTIIHDTIFFKDENIDIKVNKNTGKGTYKLPKDTIYKRDTIRLTVASKCPEVFIQQNKIKELELKHLKYKNKTIWTIVILSFLLSLSIVYFIFKILK